MRLPKGEPAIGTIEIYYPAGMRSIAIPAGSDLNAAALKGHDIWEESGERLRVRVQRIFPDGTRIGIYHWPPNGEEWTE